tara:strand:- start:311 stop:478 length:168 start_codon:yes stop_codon:yes gene_type:complete
MVENKCVILGVGVLVISGLYFGLNLVDLINFFSSWVWLVVCAVAFLVLVGYVVFG